MPNRRQLLKGTVAASAVVASGNLDPATAHSNNEPDTHLKGHIKQSVVYWCFHARGEKWSPEKVCTVTRKIGCKSVEIIEPEHWSLLKKHDLTCAIAPNGMPGIRLCADSTTPSSTRKSSNEPAR